MLEPRLRVVGRIDVANRPLACPIARQEQDSDERGLLGHRCRGEHREVSALEPRFARTIQRDQVPEDVVGAVVFLCSAQADFITGQTMVIDGGQYFH